MWQIRFWRWNVRFETSRICHIWIFMSGICNELISHSNLMSYRVHFQLQDKSCFNWSVVNRITFKNKTYRAYVLFLSSFFTIFLFPRKWESPASPRYFRLFPYEFSRNQFGSLATSITEVLIPTFSEFKMENEDGAFLLYAVSI